MNVIRFPVHFHYLNFQLFGSALKRLQYLLNHHAVENLTAVLRSKNQVHKQVTEAMAPREMTLKRFVMYTPLKNRRLARHIGDAAWPGCVAKLAYKAELAGGHLLKLGQWSASSKIGHCCGHKMPEVPLRVRECRCPGGHAEHDRDINAVINIQHKGITELMAAGDVVKAHRGLRKSGCVPVAT